MEQEKKSKSKVRELIFKDPYDPAYAERSMKVRYAVSTRRYELTEGSLSEQSFIVIREKRFGITLRYTGLERYARSLNARPGTSATAPNEKRLFVICEFLNYVLIDHYEKYEIKNIQYLTVECIEDFCNFYATRPNKFGRINCKETVSKNLNFLIGFLYTLQKRKVLKNIRDDVITKTIIVHADGRDVLKVVNNVKYHYIEQLPPKKIQDMPDSVFNAFFLITSIYDPALLFCFATQAFCGLREGEALNLRAEDSCFGSGILLTERMGEITDVELDVTSEFRIRTDAIVGGYIKRHRKQHVYPLFLNDFVALYKNHMRLLKTYKRADTKPLFVNLTPDKNGIYQALTYDSYKQRFDRILIKLQEYLMANGNLEMKTFADMMLTAQMIPHIMRHFFSVQIVLSEKGSDVLQKLMYWRGDKSPQSSATYLRNKGKFRTMYKHVVKIHGTFLAEEVFKSIEGDG